MCFRPPEATMNDHNICDECGTENPPGEEVCSNCGAKLVKKTLNQKRREDSLTIPMAPPIAPPIHAKSIPPVPPTLK